jgi:hypothetical protein
MRLHGVIWSIGSGLCFCCPPLGYSPPFSFRPLRLQIHGIITIKPSPLNKMASRDDKPTPSTGPQALGHTRPESFPLFAKLPAELRWMVWNAALQATLGPRVFLTHWPLFCSGDIPHRNLIGALWAACPESREAVVKFGGNWEISYDKPPFSCRSRSRPQFKQQGSIR